MTVTLAPTGGELFSTFQDAFTSATITASGTDLPVTWEYSINPPVDDNFIVTSDGTSLTVSYVNADGLFPFTIEYLDENEVPHVVTRWEDIPADIANSPQIINMLASLINNKVWDISVTATDSAMATASGSYTVKVEANYTLNRDLLVAAVGDRS